MMNKEEKFAISVNQEDVQNIIDCYEKDIEYIKKLEQRIKTYEDPEDLTLMFMYCDEKAKDKIKDLQQKINKAIEYMNSEEFFMKMNSNSIQPPADKYVCQDYFEAKEKLVEILGDKQCQ